MQVLIKHESQTSSEAGRKSNRKEVAEASAMPAKQKMAATEQGST
jgi:hypothetical protein